MITVSNISYSGTTLNFRLSYDPAVVAWVSPEVLVGHPDPAKCLIACSKVGSGNGWDDFQATVATSQNIEDVINGTHADYFSGFAIYAKVATYELNKEGIGGSSFYDYYDTVLIDPYGVAYIGLRPSDWSYPWLTVKGFIGFSFDGVGTVIPFPDLTDLYCEDSFEDRSYFSATGTQSNPFYSPLDALQAASIIARAYNHDVTVHIAPGRYDCQGRFNYMVDSAHTIFVRVEDWGLTGETGGATIYPGDDTNKWYLQVIGSPPIQGINHSAFPPQLSLDLKGITGPLSFSNGNVTGYLKDFTGEWLSFDTTPTNISFWGNLTLTEVKDDSVTWFNYVTFEDPIIPTYRQMKKLPYADPSFVSATWPFLKKVKTWSQAELEAEYGSYTTTTLLANGYTPDAEVPMAALHNPTNRTLPSTGGYADLSVWEGKTPVDATFENSFTGNWDGTSQTATLRHCHGIGVSVSTGTIDAANCSRISVGAANGKTVNCHRAEVKRTNWRAIDPTSTYGRALRTMTFPDPVNVVDVDGLTNQLGVVETLTLISGMDDLGFYGQSPFEFVNCSNSTFSHNSAAGQTNWFSNWAIQLHQALATWIYHNFGVYLSTSNAFSLHQSWQDTSCVVDGDPAYETDAYNLSPSSTEFVDYEKGRPTSSSSLLHAGDPTILNPDGTRSHVGRYGGPEADIVVKARISWYETLTSEVNITGYVGMTVHLSGAQSSGPIGVPLIYTWSEDPGNPAPVTFTNNGTEQGAEQDITFTAFGTYTFTLEVSDGTNTDSTSWTIEILPVRVFCVDSTKTFHNNLLPVTDPQAPELDWTGAMASEDKTYDGTVDRSVVLDGPVSRTVTLSPNTRYYLKVCVSVEPVDKKTHPDVTFKVAVVDSDGFLLFVDDAELKGSVFATEKNIQHGPFYGIGSAYFSTRTAQDVTVYILPNNGNGQFQSWLRYCYIAPADQETDAIYQDLRLAIRHHKPGDTIQVAECLVDVPLRVAGGKSYVRVLGGYDPASHDGTQYTIRDPDVHKSRMAYLRFAYFTRQRDWSYNAISIVGDLLHESWVDGLWIENFLPDLPTSWAYRPVDVGVSIEEDLHLDGLRFVGLEAVGRIKFRAKNELAGLTMDNLYMEDLMLGAEVVSECGDIQSLNGQAVRVQGPVLEIEYQKTGQTITPSSGWWDLNVDGWNLHDCGPMYAIAQGPLNEDDPILRKSSWSELRPGGTDPLPPFGTPFLLKLDYDEVNVLVRNVILTDSDDIWKSAALVGIKYPGADGYLTGTEEYGTKAKVTVEDCTADTDVALVYIYPRKYCTPLSEPDFGAPDYGGPFADGMDDATAEAALESWAATNGLGYLKVKGNIITGRALVWWAVARPLVVGPRTLYVAGNTGPGGAVYWAPPSLVTPATRENYMKSSVYVGTNSVTEGEVMFWDFQERNVSIRKYLDGFVPADVLTLINA